MAIFTKCVLRQLSVYAIQSHRQQYVNWTEDCSRRMTQYKRIGLKLKYDSMAVWQYGSICMSPRAEWHNDCVASGLETGTKSSLLYSRALLTIGACVSMILNIRCQRKQVQCFLHTRVYNMLLALLHPALRGLYISDESIDRDWV